MQLASASLAARLKEEAAQGALSPLWVIADNEPLLAQEAADEIRAAARTLGYAEREVLTMKPAGDWSEISRAVGGMSLFSELKIIEVRLQGPSPGVKGAEALTGLAAMPLEGVCVIVSVPEADWKVAKLKWFQALGAAGNVVKCEPVRREQLPGWLKSRLSGAGLRIEADALALLAEQTEGNLLAASQEVRKLALLHEGEGPVTLSEVQSCVLDNSRFDLSDISMAAMAGDAARASRAIEGIRSAFDTSQAMPLIMYTLLEDISRMLQLRVRIDAGEPPRTALRAMRVFPFEKADAVLAGATRLSAARLRNALSVCADIDKLYKGLRVPDRDSDPWTELKSVVTFLAR